MGETRKMNIERDSQCVGFTIGSGPQGGVFVSSVQEDSLAMEAGLVIGDQLLEVIYQNWQRIVYLLLSYFYVFYPVTIVSC